MKKSDLITLGVEKYFLEKKDIEELLLFYLKVTREELFKLEDIPDDIIPAIEAGYARMMKTEPVQYVTRRASFYSREFYVDSRVLVPRIDTEVLVDKVLEYNKNLRAPAILCDIGTGSGCIGQSIFLSQNPGNIEKLFAFDISSDAIEVAKINASKHSLLDRVEFIPEGFDAFERHFEKSIYKADISEYIITANLPYIRTVDLGGMESSVFFHEPSVALFGGRQTGFELYRRFLAILKGIQDKNKGIHLVLFMEFGYDQYEESKTFLGEMNVKFEHFKDTNNIWRVIKVTF